MTLLNQQMSQIAINFRQKVVDDYLMKLAAARKVQQTEVVESSDDKVELTCFTLDPNHKLPKGFTLSTSQKGKENLKHEELQYQYDLRSVAEVKGRPKANRVPFFNIAEVFGDKQRTVSHLCHNSWCMNPRHFVMETLAENKGRNGCPSGNFCLHKPKCLRPGRFSRSEAAVVQSKNLAKFEL